MKKFVFVMSLFAMMTVSLSAKAQDITITLQPGCTWFSYPEAEVKDIPSALGDFVPMSGDMIKAQSGVATYTNGRWRGSITQFIPACLFTSHIFCDHCCTD